MWTSLAFILFVLATLSSASGPWQANTEYTYSIHSRTYTGIPELRQQYAGVVSQGQLVVQVENSSNSGVLLVGQVRNFRHRTYNADISNIDQAYIPDNQDEYTAESSLNGKPFRMYLEQGVIQKLEVDNSLTNDEVNQLKGILSQLQVDIQGKNLIQWPHNQVPVASGGSDIPSGLYRTMEPSITGNCETAYEITPVPDYAFHNFQFHGAADFSIPEGRSAFHISKTVNFSNCALARSFHYGIAGWNEALNVQSNQIGSFLSRSLSSQIVAVGSPAEFTIYYSQSSMNVAAAPELFQQQNTMTTSKVELILSNVVEYNTQLPAPNQPQDVGSLVYRYNYPSDKSNRIRAGSDGPVLSQPEQNQGNTQYQCGFEHNWGAQQDNFYQPLPASNYPGEHPFLPYYVGHQGHAIWHDVDIAAQVVSLANEINKQAQDDDHNENIPQKFNILVELVASATFEKLWAVHQELNNAAPSSATSVPGARELFHDAVAVAGSQPANFAIVKWVKDGVLSDRQAIAALSIQPKFVKTPTKQTLEVYLDMIKSSNVVNQPEVYSVALLSFAELIGRSYSDYKYAKNYYPEDSYGTFRENLTDTIQSQVITYYAQSLQSAFESGKNREILTNIRAYGHLGHLSYLSVFKKYYESEKPLPVVQRVALVLALNNVAKAYPDSVHPVLYKIYRNLAEHSDVRSVAVVVLVNTNSSPSVFQNIAAFTSNDPSVQVKSVVTYGIQTVANLQGPEDQERAARAQAAIQFLSPNIITKGHSYDSMFADILEHLNYNRHHHVTIMASSDSPVPNMVHVHAFDNWGGVYKTHHRASTMVSNVRELFRHFYWPQSPIPDNQKGFQKIFTNANAGQDNQNGGLPQVPLPPQFQSLVQHFEKLLYGQQLPQWQNESGNRKRQSGRSGNPSKPVAPSPPQSDRSEDVQGQFEFDFLGGSRYYAFDHDDIQGLPSMLNNWLQSYKNGREFHFTKYFKDNSIAVAFPMSSGYPYVYSFDSPVVVKANGNVSVEVSAPLDDGQTSSVKIPAAVNVTAHAHLVYSKSHVTQTGFVTPFSGRHYVAGHVRNIMYHFPIYVDVDVDLIHHTVNGGFMPVGQETVAHFSSVPYTIEKDSFSVVPDIAQTNSVIPVHARQTKAVNRTIGAETTGIVLTVKGQYETLRDVYGPLPYLVGGIPRSGLIDAFLQPSEGLEAYNIEVFYDNMHTKTDGVMFGVSVKSGVIRANPAQPQNNASRGGRKAKHEGVAFLLPVDKLFNLITPKITYGKATVFSAWVAFAGPGSQTVYEAVGSYSASQPEGLTRFTAGFRKNELNYFNEKQYCFEINAKERGNTYYATSSLDQAIKENPEVGVQFRVTVGPNCIVGDEDKENTELVGVAIFNQTVAYEQYVLNNLDVAQCKHDVAEGNHQTPACRRAIRDLRVPNTVSFNMHQTGSKRYVPDILAFIAHMQTNPIVKNTILAQDKIEPVSGSFFLSRDSKYYDGSITYGNVQLPVHDLVVDPIVRSIAFDEEFYTGIPFSSAALHRDSVCVIDNNQIFTFDQARVNSSVGRCTYLAMQTIAPFSHSDLPAARWYQDRNVTIMVVDEQGVSYARQVIVEFYLDTQGLPYTIDVRGRGTGFRPEVILWQGQENNVLDTSQHTEIVVDGVVVLHVYPQTTSDDNVVVMDLHSGSLRVAFNGDNLRIEADSYYANRVHGLCGQNDNEHYNDIQSPRNCVFRDNKYFVPSWAIPQQQSFCSAEVKKAWEESQNAACFPVEYVPNAVVNDYEAASGQCYSTSGASYYKVMNAQGPKLSPNHNMLGNNCRLYNQVQYVERPDEICFSAVPLASCPKQCRAGSHYQSKVSARCYHKNDPLVRLHKQSIAKSNTKWNWGSNAVERTLIFNVPKTCRNF